MAFTWCELEANSSFSSFIQTCMLQQHNTVNIQKCDINNIKAYEICQDKLKKTTFITANCQSNMCRQKLAHSFSSSCSHSFCLVFFHMTLPPCHQSLILSCLSLWALNSFSVALLDRVRGKMMPSQFPRRITTLPWHWFSKGHFLRSSLCNQTPSCPLQFQQWLVLISPVLYNLAGV